MKPINIEKLMIIQQGLSNSYYRATEAELLKDCLKAVEFLRINDNHRLQKQTIHISEKTKKLVLSKQRDNDIAELKAAIEFLKNKINAAVVSDPSSEILVMIKAYQQ